MKVLVCGRSGQVGSALFTSESPKDLEIIVLGRPILDITNTASIMSVFGEVEPDLVINAAAYTAVDQAETDEASAESLNARAAGALAKAANDHGAPIIHLSTDYVYDGSKMKPYKETDPVSPLGVYGRTKLIGEQKVAENNSNNLILRTAWVYSVFGNNFVKTMLRVANDRDELNVVSDQWGCPTSAHDIASALINIVAKHADGPGVINGALYHLAGTGEATWADLAEHVFDVSAAKGGPNARVNRISSDEWPTPVTRPTNSRLDCSALSRDFDIQMPDWRESVRECVEELIETGAYT